MSYPVQTDIDEAAAALARARDFLVGAQQLMDARAYGTAAEYIGRAAAALKAARWSAESADLRLERA